MKCSPNIISAGRHLAEAGLLCQIREEVSGTKVEAVETKDRIKLFLSSKLFISFKNNII